MNKNRFSQLFYSKTGMLVIALGIRIAMSLVFIGRFHPDEISRGLEKAYTIIYPDTRTNFVSPYYYDRQLWSYLWPWLLVPLLYVAISIGLQGLQIFQFIHIVFGVINILGIALVLNLYDEDTVKGRLRKFGTGWMLTLFWPFVFYGIQALTDAVAVFLLLVILPLFPKFMKGHLSDRVSFALGLLLAISVSLRRAYLLLWLPVLIWAMRHRRSWFIVGFPTGFIPYLLLDWYYYGSPVASSVNFITYNIVDQSQFGAIAKPWWYYLVTIPVVCGGIFGTVLAIYLFNWGREYVTTELRVELVLLGMLIYTGAHLFLRLKEIRFMLPMLVLFVVFSGAGIPSLKQRLSKGRHKLRWKTLTTLVVVVYLISLLVLPYNAYGNIFKGQDYIHRQDPDANVAIDTYYWGTGGHLLQHGGEIGVIEILFDFHSDDYILRLPYDYIILDTTSDAYHRWIELFGGSCDQFELVVEFKDTYSYTVTPLLFDVAMVEVYRC